MSAADLRQMIDLASGLCDKQIARTGAIAPMWHAVTRTGETMITLHPTDVDKDTGAAMMRALFELRDVVRCVFVSEAWIGESETIDGVNKLQAWVDEHGSLEDYPGRIEVVIFAGEDIEAGQVTAHRRIERGGGKPRLGSLKVDIFSQSEGRLIGMLPRSKAAVH